ncbi:MULTISPECIES: hypothetical protein [unclassified Thioalkalivibrio]|uniref:hypothetical protein n=1 Tax=unclassified Thioalkalivibrio TaxID=2621013 RepID=UPI00037B03D5|nr:MULTISPECIES: hypothetical protein [unclassified Thioalkalivibrio]
MMRLIFTLLRMRRLMRLYRMFAGGGGNNRSRRQHQPRESGSRDKPHQSAPGTPNRDPDDHQQ